jgi:hypothetical protein
LKNWLRDARRSRAALPGLTVSLGGRCPGPACGGEMKRGKFRHAQALESRPLFFQRAPVGALPTIRREQVFDPEPLYRFFIHA